jgi:hypothetical protein
VPINTLRIVRKPVSNIRPTLCASLVLVSELAKIIYTERAVAPRLPGEIQLQVYLLKDISMPVLVLECISSVCDSMSPMNLSSASTQFQYWVYFYWSRNTCHVHQVTSKGAMVSNMVFFQATPAEICFDMTDAGRQTRPVASRRVPYKLVRTNTGVPGLVPVSLYSVIW